jgi:hypothetical protein
MLLTLLLPHLKGFQPNPRSTIKMYPKSSKIKKRLYISRNVSTIRKNVSHALHLLLKVILSLIRARLSKRRGVQRRPRRLLKKKEGT